MENTIASREDAKRFWAEYDRIKAQLMTSDLETGLDRETKWERGFWADVYTANVHVALKSFGLEYSD
jgi:hypothetical protein